MPDRPHTRATIAEDLAALGLRRGDTVLAHASLSSVGWVCGGAVAVVQALIDVLGSEGTLVVPAQTMNNSDPRHWTSPPVPEGWWPVIRRSMPAFDPRITPSWGIGAIGEMVRQWPGAVRSNHPHTSFAAVGAAAGELMAEHRLDSHLGEHSPLGALEHAGARVLLLGVGFNSCTAFHLAEYRVPAPRTEFGGAVLTASGDREWITYTDVATNSDDFTDLGEAFENTGAVTKAQVGQAVTRLFDLDKAVAHAVAWLPQHRKLP